MVKTLRQTAEIEGYMNDETKAQIDTLAKLLTHNLDKDLDTHREEIEEYLGDEIVARYYYDRGKMAYNLRTDKALKLATDLIKSGWVNNTLKGNKK